MEPRRNIRAAFSATVTLRGTDRRGNPFVTEARGLDFSRNGLALELDQDLVAPGSVVTIGIPKKFEANAVVQWTRPDASGRVRLGTRLTDRRASVPIRIAAAFVLCLALLGQTTLARSRGTGRTQPNRGCTVSLQTMQSVLQAALGQYRVISESEKAFLHVQHQQMGCAAYTRAFENTTFFADPRLRDAIARWHWRTYHSGDTTVRTSAVQSIEAGLAGY